MSNFDLKVHPHRRFNPLLREWVLVSPHRMQRPWQGQVEVARPEVLPRFDPDCYLCPGNARAGGLKNPSYSGTYVFENDFSALRPDTPSGDMRQGPLLIAQSERGCCRVVCFSPRHDLTLARMSVPEIRRIVEVWCEETSTLGGDPQIHSVQIFENRGAIMGCSNPHPHGQIWANENVPDELARELASSLEYSQARRLSLLGDYLELELQSRERIVCANEHFVVLIPFWAVWPFETMLLCRRPVCSLVDLQEPERTALADILRQIAIRYDNLFETSFAYTMGFHQRPTDGKEHPGFQLHAHFYPPLLRSATVKKFMVGYEMLAMPQRDLTAEAAATRLRDVPASHYLDRR